MSIRKGKRGYVATVEVGSGGKRMRKVRQFDKMHDARRWEQEMEALKEQVAFEDYDIPFCHLATKWLEHKKDLGLAKSTLSKYENGLRVAKQFPFYTKKARDVKMPELEAALNALARDYSKSYIADIKATVSAVFAFGVDQDYLIKNPCSRAALPRKAQEGRDIRSYSEAEVGIIESYRDAIYFGDVIYVMLRTGLRSQEVCCLTASSVVKEGNHHFINVENAMTREHGHWVVGDTKTASSKRMVPITKEVAAVVLERSMASPRRLFITGRDGDHISYSGFREAYKSFFDTLAESEDIPYLPPHCLRHTFASRCEWSGIKSSITKEIMGHTTEAMTHNYTDIMHKDTYAAIVTLK